MQRERLTPRGPERGAVVGGARRLPRVQQRAGDEGRVRRQQRGGRALPPAVLGEAAQVHRLAAVGGPHRLEHLRRRKGTNRGGAITHSRS